MTEEQTTKRENLIAEDEKEISTSEKGDPHRLHCTALGQNESDRTEELQQPSLKAAAATAGSRPLHLPPRGRGRPPTASVCLQGETQHSWAAETMQLGLVALAVVFLSSMGYNDSFKVGGRRHRRKCKIENCADCFSRTFCAKCKEGLYSYSGRCYHSCPEGLTTVNSTMECVVQCELGEWSQWGPCMKKNKTCGFKKGNQNRRREPTQPPSPATVTGPASASTCAPESETRKCTVQKKIPCAKGDKGTTSKNRGPTNGKNRGRDSKESAKGGGKRKKTQNPATTAPSIITSTVT
ncbi:hypothetical protein NFI96_032164 [Prochilodus magdalenae]|nr:hypothetical protein NFI96_032164 [Prochilodus magdalenae]